MTAILGFNAFRGHSPDCWAVGGQLRWAALPVHTNESPP
jgi:hypothetical protein